MTADGEVAVTYRLGKSQQITQWHKHLFLHKKQDNDNYHQGKN